MIYRFKSLFLGFHHLAFRITDTKEIIRKDLDAWQNQFLYSKKIKVDLNYLLIYYPQFRSIFYHRLKRDKRKIIKTLRVLAEFFFKPLFSLLITTEEIGGGLFIQHGYCTVISAKHIGNNCWINQGVTIGYTNVTDAPEIGDNVKIYAGAKVLGAVKVGNNSIIGANAVVIKDVTENSIVGGVPAREIGKNEGK
ncbi:MAG: serine acetyltransferase [Enterococcus sp.]|nr:serine acetyltransferase [Enterococcus sp.]